MRIQKQLFWDHYLKITTPGLAGKEFQEISDTSLWVKAITHQQSIFKKSQIAKWGEDLGEVLPSEKTRL